MVPFVADKRRCSPRVEVNYCCIALTQRHPMLSRTLFVKQRLCHAREFAYIVAPNVRARDCRLRARDFCCGCTFVVHDNSHHCCDKSEDSFLFLCACAVGVCRITVAAREELAYTKYTPASRQNLISELLLQKTCREHGNAELANRAWKAAVMPLYALVRQVSTGCHFFIMKVLSVSMYLWPASLQVAPNLYHFDLDITKLVHVCVFDFDDYVVKAGAMRSPASIRAEDSNHYS